MIAKCSTTQKLDFLRDRQSYEHKLTKSNLKLMLFLVNTFIKFIYAKVETMYKIHPIVVGTKVFHNGNVKLFLREPLATADHQKTVRKWIAEQPKNKSRHFFDGICF